MDEFDFIFNKEHLEIFPPEIYNDPYVVFHGTSEYHSNNIEQNGFEIGTAPFDLTAVKELLEILRNKEFGDNCEILDAISNYINAIERKDFHLSFASLSYYAAFFAQGVAKGGQSLVRIREAEQNIQQVIASNSSLQKQIRPTVKNLFKSVNDIFSSKGVVYAIKLPDRLLGIYHNVGVIYSSKSLSNDLIIGKIILPKDFLMSESERKKAYSFNKIKAMKTSIRLNI